MDRGEAIGTLYVELITRDRTTDGVEAAKRSLTRSAAAIEKEFAKVTDGVGKKIRFLPTLFDEFFGYGAEQFRKAAGYLDHSISDATLKLKILEEFIKERPFERLLFNPDLSELGGLGLADEISNVPEVYLLALKEIAKYEEQIRKQSAAFTASYYETMKFHAKDYYDYKVSLIQAEADQMQALLGEAFDYQKFFSLKLESLNREKEKFLLDWAEKESNKRKSDNWTMPPSNLNQSPDSIWDPDNPGLLKYTPVVPMPDYDNWNREALFKDFIESSRMGQHAFELLSKTVAEQLDFMQIKLSSTASVMDRMWAELINGMIQKTTELISQWLVLQLIGGIFGFGGINLGSFLGLSDPEDGKGGKTLESWTGIRKFASGGDFIVPPGFANDSYPMLVQSGERVRVTPTGSVGEEARLLNKVIAAIEANTLDRRMLGARPVIVQPTIQLGARELTKEIKRTDQTISREGFK